MKTVVNSGVVARSPRVTDETRQYTGVLLGPLPDHLNKCCIDDLTTWYREMAHLTGIGYGGVSLD